MTKLTAADMRPEFLSTLPNGETIDALVQRLEKGDVTHVIYLGGDGTFAEVATSVLLNEKGTGNVIPVGMLPMGTANDQGRSFGVMAGKEALDTNIEIIRQGHKHLLDAGHLRTFDIQGNELAEHYWFDSFGVGLSAEILARRNRDREWAESTPGVRRLYRGKSIYVGAGLNLFAQTVAKGWKFRCSLTVDDWHEPELECVDLMIMDTALYAGDWVFSKETRPDDGLFEVVVMNRHRDMVSSLVRAHKRAPWNRASEGTAAGKAPKKSPLFIKQGSKIVIQLHGFSGETPPAAQIDGEELCVGVRYEITNLPRRIQVIAPQEFKWL